MQKSNQKSMSFTTGWRKVSNNTLETKVKLDVVMK